MMRNIRSLGGNDIHLWVAHDRTIRRHQLAGHCHATLSTAEQARAERFYFVRDRHRFIVSRCMLRAALSGYRSEIAPAEWIFDVAETGRPAIASHLNADIGFSISHGDGLIAIAFAARPRIGLDVERLDRRLGDVTRPVRFLSEAERHFVNAGQTETARSQRLVSIWTLKEAYTKAIDIGLKGIGGISFVPTADPPRLTVESVDGSASGPWHFRQMVVGDHLIAVARECEVGDLPAIAVIEWTPAIGGRGIAAGAPPRFAA